jgi:hypothetical protein
MSRLVKITLGVACGLLTALCLSQLHPPHEREAMTPRLVSDADLALTEISVHYRSDFHDECIETLQDLLDGLPQEVTVRVVTESQAEFNFLKDRLARSATSPQLRAVITGMPITPWSKDRFGTMTAEGNPVLARNEPLTDEGKENLLAAIGKTFGKKVVRIGDDARDMPDHHIGMYLTPLGNGRLAVADPDMGLQMCRELNNITKIAGVTVETDSACYKPFRNVIQLLQDQHIDFIRVPMILTTLPRVYATYNNAIVEERHGVRRIFMPTYGVPELDRRAAALFEEQGLQVIPVRVSKLFKHTGSLRCLVGVIRRS